MTVRMSN